MDFWNGYVETLKKYATFDGRASRREYWGFTLVSLLISIALTLADWGVGFTSSILSTGPLEALYSIAVFLPSIGVSIRRNHDVNKSGWFMLVPFYNLYLTLKQGDKGPNRFGADPYGVDSGSSSDDDSQDGSTDDPLITRK